MFEYACMLSYFNDAPFYATFLSFLNSSHLHLYKLYGKELMDILEDNSSCAPLKKKKLDIKQHESN